MKARGHDFIPLPAPALVQCSAGDAQARIAPELRQHRLDEIGLEGDVGVDPEDHVAVGPQLRVQEALQHGLAAGMALAAAGHVMDFDPSVAARGGVKQRGRGVARPIIDYDPAQRQAGLRDHALDQTRQEFLLVAGGSYGAVSFHARYP